VLEQGIVLNGTSRYESYPSHRSYKRYPRSCFKRDIFIFDHQKKARLGHDENILRLDKKNFSPLKSSEP
jgi:hypothetical protein